MTNKINDQTYNPEIIEKYWQDFWENSETFLTRSNQKQNYYVLSMFPYPSGRIHMGHVRVYTLGDVLARYKRAQGYNVLHPMGWDAFGMPAENAAFENKVHPRKWTTDNIKIMKSQLKSMGVSYDWSKEIATCDEDYIKHQQELFIKLYKAELIYRKKAWANWDPVENTVLANEQVIDGKGWRSGAIVEKRLLNQWFFAITKFAEPLLNDLKTLPNWPEKVKTMQRNWIGKSEGLKISFSFSKKLSLDFEFDSIEIYTTRPDTIFGASFIAIAPDHAFSNAILLSNLDAKKFVDDWKLSSNTEESIERATKKGLFTGYFVIHPFTKKELPIYIANFVLSSYGTGAIFGVPAHDQRDYDFAKLYKLNIKYVINSNQSEPETNQQQAYEGDGYLINSDFLNNLSVSEAKEVVINKIEKLNIGKRTIQYRLRDWCASRQRYWGCPVPMVHCLKCGIIPEAKDNLPVELPNDVNFDKVGNPLDFHPSWKITTCPVCKGKAERDTQTLDTFVGSAWYYYRYLNPESDTPIDKAKSALWCPIHQYVGGIEHAILHLLYSRFFTKALKSIGLIDINEPFDGLFCQGMVCHQTFKDESGNWLYPEEVYKKGNELLHVRTSKKVTAFRSEKMSKSKKNVVDPVDIIKNYGADVARFFMLSDSPPERSLEWTDNGIEGSSRYINKIWRYYNTVHPLPNKNAVHSYDEEAKSLKKTMHITIDKVTKSLESFQYNVAVASLREFSNTFMKNINNPSELYSLTLKEAMDTWLILSSPMIPHITEELWKKMGYASSITQAKWPKVNASLIQDNYSNIVVQINGKKKCVIKIKKDLNEERVKKIILEDELIIKLLKNLSPKKIIVIPNRVLNIVI